MKRLADKPQIIRLIFQYRGNAIVVSTGAHCEPRHWDDRNQRCRESVGPPQYRHINLMLSRWEAITVELYYEYKAAGRMPEHTVFRNELLKRLGKAPADDSAAKPSLLQFAAQFIEERRAMGRPKGSLAVYENTFSHLEAYAKERRRKVDWGDIGEKWKNDFFVYLLSKQFADSHSHKLFSTLKTIVREGWRRGYINEDPFARFKLPVQKRDSDKIYLTEAELQTLADMDLSANPRLERTRDLFLIGAFTGLRFSDFSEIKPENIRPIEDGGKTVTCIVKTTQKTGRKVYIPLTNPNLLVVLERNGMKAPRKISNQKLNDYIKELCQIAGFDGPVEITEFRAGRQSSQVFKKYELVGTHTARRSFATNALKRGLPVNEIMRFTGHTTMTSFMKYVRTGAQETAVSLADHEFFTGKKDEKQTDAEGRNRD